MLLTEEQNKRLTEMLMIIEQDIDSLRAKEADFIRDQIVRHKEWGSNLRLSPAQWKWLEDIFARISGEPQAADRRMNGRPPY